MAHSVQNNDFNKIPTGKQRRNHKQTKPRKQNIVLTYTLHQKILKNTTYQATP